MRDYNFFDHYKKTLEIDPKSAIFQSLALVLLGAVCCAVLVIGNLVLSSQVATLQEEIHSLKVEKSYIEANILKMRMDTMDQYDQLAGGLLKQFKETKQLGVETLQSLTAAMPQSVTLNSLLIDQGSASMEFAAPNRRAAAELLLNLKNSDLFTQVELGSILASPNSNQFIVMMTAVMRVGETK